jgi:hypothetical protein
MAETFKEFGNQNYTSSDITNNDEIVIFTNNASTKAIVRDIEVQSNDFEADEAKFYVDGTIVGDTFEDSDGTVFVDESQSFSVKLNTALTAPQTETVNGIHVSIPSANAPTLAPTTLTQVKGTPPYPTTGLSTGSTVGAGVDINPPVNFIQPANNYQYMIHDVGNNSDYWVYQRDSNSHSNMSWWDGTNSIRQQVDTDSYRGGYIDGEAKKAYVNNGGTIKVWDMTQQSATPTTFSGFYTTNSTYSVGSACNGVYFYTYNGTAQNLWFRDTINHPSGTYGQITNTATGYNFGASVAYPVVVVAFNSDEEKYYILSGNATDITASTENVVVTKQQILDSNSTGTINPTISLGTGLRTCLGLSTSPSNSAGNFYAWNLRHMGGPYVSFPLSDTTVGVWKCENDTLTQVETMTVSNDTTIYGRRNSYVQANGTLTTANYNVSNYTINNRIRTVGVEIT